MILLQFCRLYACNRVDYLLLSRFCPDTPLAFGTTGEYDEDDASQAKAKEAPSE